MINAGGGTKCAILRLFPIFLRIFFYSDQPTQNQETQLTVNKEKKGMA